MSANFLPSLVGYKETGQFRFWCQHVLPAVYDDSLSYYELLCKVVKYLNDVIENLDIAEGNIDAIHQAYQELEGYVNDYFDSLDVTTAINNKLDTMASNGQLLQIIAPTIASNTASWLANNITEPEGVVIDTSLMVAGACADAQQTGLGISHALNGITRITTNFIVNANGELAGSTSANCVTDYINVMPSCFYDCYPTYTSTTGIWHAFYDGNKNFISSIYASQRYFKTPSNARYVRLSLASQWSEVCALKYIKPVRNIIVFGDSWSDTDPSHTTYTKWPSLLGENSEYNVGSYAQNGSLISGDEANYGENGNLLGQIERFLTTGASRIDTFIIMGGINDFRSGIQAGEVARRLQLTYQRLRLNYPYSRIVYIANHQLFITDEQIRYFDFIANYCRRIVGMEAYLSFGWIPPTNYISDKVHPDNAGYYSILANVMSILNGGEFYYVTNEHEFGSVNDGLVITVKESWINGKPFYEAEGTVYTAGLGQEYLFDFSTSDDYYLGSVPFTKLLAKVQPSSANVVNSVLDDVVEKTFSTQYKMNGSNRFRILCSPVNSGLYRG